MYIYKFFISIGHNSSRSKSYYDIKKYKNQVLGCREGSGVSKLGNIPV